MGAWVYMGGCMGGCIGGCMGGYIWVYGLGGCTVQWSSGWKS